MSCLLSLRKPPVDFASGEPTPASYPETRQPIALDQGRHGLRMNAEELCDLSRREEPFGHNEIPPRTPPGTPRAHDCRCPGPPIFSDTTPRRPLARLRVTLVIPTRRASSSTRDAGSAPEASTSSRNSIASSRAPGSELCPFLESR